MRPGTALFVTVLTAQSATLAAGGAGRGRRDRGRASTRAFLVGAVISLVAIPPAFFVRKAAPSPHGAPADEAAPALAH